MQKPLAERPTVEWWNDLNTPRHIAIDGSDNLYVADAGNHRVQILASFQN